MDPDDSFDVDAADDIFHEVFGVKPWLNKINAADKPFFCCFALLKADVPSCFEFCEQFSDGDFVDFSEFFVDGFEDAIDMVDFFLFKIINALEFFDFLHLHADVIDFYVQIS